MSDGLNMDSRERAETIRQGNRAFNEGDIRKARDLFIKAEYKDGLVRLGDHFMYEKNALTCVRLLQKGRISKTDR